MEDYHYRPHQEVMNVPTDEQAALILAPAVLGLSPREEHDIWWNKQRQANRHHNMELYTGSILKRSGRPTR